MAVGVNLPAGQTASAVFQSILMGAAERFDALAPYVEGLNKQNLADRLIPFEAARAAISSPGRVDAAALMARLGAERLVYVLEDDVEVPLSEYMVAPADPLSLTARELGSARGLTPRIHYDGKTFAGQEIRYLADDMARRNTITEAAHDGLSWVARQSALDLTGQKFAVLGAGAELAPTEILLRAGATVLFIDLVSAEKFVADRSIQSGTIVYAPQGANLLTHPAEIAATIEAFAAGDAVHVGAYAYVGGKAMEWRLTGVMNAIIRSLDPSIVQSIGLYVSPTAPAQAQTEDVVTSLAGYSDPSFWDRAWKKMGVLKRNLHQHGETHWPRNIVSLQGASYLAAQYLEKRLAAEVFATRGIGTGEKQPITVSANVAGITQTRSMQIPTFQAGFLGAPALGIETYLPETTRWLSGLLYLEGILDPEAVASAKHNPFEDENEKARRMSSVQVHGAVYSHPYAIEGAIARAALIGLRKKPSLIPGFVGSLMGKK